MAEQITLSQETVGGLAETGRQWIDASERANEILADYWTNAFAPAVQKLLDALGAWYDNLPSGCQLLIENYQARDYFTAMLDTGEDQ